MGDANLAVGVGYPALAVLVAGDLAAAIFTQQLSNVVGYRKGIQRAEPLADQIEDNAVTAAVLMRNAWRVRIRGTAGRIVEGEILHAVLRRAHDDAGVDRGLEQLARDEGGKVVAPLAEIFGAEQLAIFGERAIDDLGVESGVELQRRAFTTNTSSPS